MTDDTEKFHNEALLNSKKLYRDESILKISRQLLHKLDEYNYSYLWRSGGLPIIQTPADIVALQEVIWDTKPTCIIETGVARGGSLINSAMCMHLNGTNGTVIGIDIDIRHHNKTRIETHKFSEYIDLVEGSSDSIEIFNKVNNRIKDTDRVMVILDSNHTYDHVLKELRLWGKLVTKGCYLVVADTMLYYATEQVKGSTHWESGDDPLSALKTFLSEDNSGKFMLDEAINGKLIFSGCFNGYLECLK
jgi:cephalosporin hydroxylase